MIKPTTAVILALLAAGCASTPADKTPRTVNGQLNSCMLGEIYSRQEAGKLAADEWTAAREVFGVCMRRLDLSGDNINATQSLNIAASVIQSLRPKSKPTAKK